MNFDPFFQFSRTSNTRHRHVAMKKNTTALPLRCLDTVATFQTGADDHLTVSGMLSAGPVPSSVSRNGRKMTLSTEDWIKYHIL
eukprot:s305_g4.t1